MMVKNAKGPVIIYGIYRAVKVVNSFHRFSIPSCHLRPLDNVLMPRIMTLGKIDNVQFQGITELISMNLSEHHP